MIEHRRRLKVALLVGRYGRFPAGLGTPSPDRSMDRRVAPALLTTEIAEALASFVGALCLDGLTTLSPQAAGAALRSDPNTDLPTSSANRPLSASSSTTSR